MPLFGRKKSKNTKRASRRISQINFANIANTNPQVMYRPGENSFVSTFTDKPNTVRSIRVPPPVPPRRKRSSTKSKSVHKQPNTVFNPNEIAISSFYSYSPPPPPSRKLSKRRSSARSSRASRGSTRSSRGSTSSIDTLMNFNY
jgi:hypothetical protein